MKTRLQVLVEPGIDARVRKAAQRRGLSKGAWVREAIEAALEQRAPEPDPLARLQALRAPAADIDQMLAEIGAGRSRMSSSTPTCR